MAIIQCTFSSMSLHRPVNFTAVLPGDSMFPMPGPMKPLKTLYLLHGYGGGSMEWFKSSCNSFSISCRSISAPITGPKTK